MLLPVVAVFSPEAKPGIRTLTPMKSPTADRAILSRFGLQPPSAGFRGAPHTQTGRVYSLLFRASRQQPVTTRCTFGLFKAGETVWILGTWYVVPWTVPVTRGGV